MLLLTIVVNPDIHLQSEANVLLLQVPGQHQRFLEEHISRTIDRLHLSKLRGYNHTL